MKRRRLPPVLFLLALALLSLAFRRYLSLPLPIGASRFAGGSDALLRRLAAIDVGGDQILAEAAALLANASVSTFPSLGNHHRLLYLRVPYRSNATSAPRQRTVSRLRVPFHGVPSDAALLAAFRTSLRGFLLARQHHRYDVAGAMADLPALLLGPGRRDVRRRREQRHPPGVPPGRADRRARPRHPPQQRPRRGLRA